MRLWMALGLVLLSVLPAAADELPKMKFNEVAQIAPGVYFRYSSISATDKTVPFGGSNNTWIVFEDYVVVIDANFPTGANECIEAIKKTTNKPIRYVFDTHHHGDHAYGNDVFAKAGASIVAQTNCARLLRVNGPKEFEDAGKAPGEKYGVDKSKLKVPNLVFDDKLVLDDGTQRVEFLFMGHAHTAGDAVAYLPKHKILCTGDACVNGAFNYMGHSDSASWIRALERMQQLDVKTVCPGHGPMAGKDLLERQKRYFVELREIVRKGIAAKKNPEEIHKSLELAWYKEWTGVEPAIDNVKFVFDEFTGRTAPADLIEDFGLYAGLSPTKDTPGWKKPRRIVVPSGLMPARLEELKLIAPDIEFVPARSAEDAVKVVADADAILGFTPTPELLKAGKNLRWLQVGHAGVEKELPPELVKSDVVLTNTARIYGPQAADQAFALLLSLTRRVKETTTETLPDLTELHGKTMLVVGLGGVGTQIARRAEGFGMRVMAIDPKEMERPAFVFSLDKPEKLAALLSKADVVMLACPLTAETRGLIGKKQLDSLKPSALLINVGRGGLVDTGALVTALSSKQIAGAGLDVTDPEPLPSDHSLRQLKNVVVSAHVGDQSPEGRERQWRLFRENVRRFVAGEQLLCVVDKVKGY